MRYGILGHGGNGDIVMGDIVMGRTLQNIRYEPLAMI